MVKRIGGSRRKTRHKLMKPSSRKGKMSIRNYYQSFKEDELVVFKAEPSVHKGIYSLKLHGKSGKIVGMRGDCYIVSYRQGSKLKKTIVHPVHLKRHCPEVKKCPK
ncbi:50S ribosomal protein L21e [Candidatus Woesearchaeota archaeon]|nr:50S ribosomal protein L21e [Candidatus Woesearchaeota archaeon]